MLLKERCNLIVIAVICVFANPIFAQEGVKVLHKSMKIEITVNTSNELKIIVEESMEKKVLDVSKVKGYEISESIFYEEEFESKPTIAAYTFLPNQGKNGKKMVVHNFPVEDYLSDGVFYSGTKRYLINYPYVQNGAILHYDSKIMVHEPRLLPSFFFDHYLTCDVSELTVTVDPNVELGVLDFFRGFDEKIQFSETTLPGGFKLYHWKGEGFLPRKYEDDAGGISCTSPHTIVRVKSFLNNREEKIPVLENKEDLFKWYSSLIKEEYVLKSSYSTIVDSLKNSSAIPTERAENIFNWVQHNVKYIAYEDGMGGFIPRHPNSVINNRYGDCKDMAMLTKTLMNACGLECHIAWVGTRDKCYTYESCPTPATDNHMIAAYPLEGKYLFLDPTSAYSEFGKPSAFIQGKEAMIRKNATEFEVIKIEEIEAKENYNIDSLTIEISGKNLLGHGTNRLGGFEKIDYEYALDYSTLPLNALFAKYLGLGNESFIVSDLNQRNTDSNKGEICSDFTFELKNYVHQFNNQLVVVPFLKEIPMEGIGERTSSLDFDYNCLYQSVIKLKIPDGYKVISLPEPMVLNENGIYFEVSVKQLDGEVVISQSFSRDELQITSEKFKEVDKTIKTINKKLKQSIELANEEI